METSLLNLPNEVCVNINYQFILNDKHYCLFFFQLILYILEVLPLEDILEVRATCKYLYEFCNERLMSKAVLYFNYCKFPTEVMPTFNTKCVPKKIHFGEQVEFVRSQHAFLHCFGLGIKSISFYQCKNLDDEIFLFLLQFFPNIEDLEIKAHFLSVDEIFGKNTQLVRDENKNMLRRVFRNLKRFSTECCYVSPQQFNDLVELMPKLESIKVSYISAFESCLTPRTISSFVRSRVMQLQHLECGDSASDGIDDKFFLEMAELTDLQLKKFTFSMKSVGEEALKAFLNTQTCLETLEIYHSWKMSNEIVEYIGENLINLKVLALKNGVPRLRGLSFIRPLKDLEELHLIDNRDVMSTFKFNDDFHVSYGLDEPFPALKILSLDNMMRGICVNCWQKIAQSFPNLKELSLYRNKIDDNSLPMIFRYLTNLEELYLNRCNQITDDGMLDAFPYKKESFSFWNLKKLRTLQLRRCSKITDKTFTAMDYLYDLKDLDLSEVNITHAAIHVIATKCPKLERLCIMECRYFNEDCLQSLCSNLVRLKNLNISRSRYAMKWNIVSSNCKYLQVSILNLKYISFGRH